MLVDTPTHIALEEIITLETASPPKFFIAAMFSLFEFLVTKKQITQTI
jgi:hypothetical protein